MALNRTFILAVVIVGLSGLGVAAQRGLGRGPMTTTVGIKTPEGIVLATDRRATMGYYVADKDVVKIEALDDNSAITIAA